MAPADLYTIVDVDDSRVDTTSYCGANPLGHARKREWIRQCLPDGLRYKVAIQAATGQAAGMIEYMPVETTWRAVRANRYLVIHCLQVPEPHRGRGLGSALVQACLADAKRQHLNGVAVLATSKGWCADSRLFLKNSFEVVDRAAPAFELLAFACRPSQKPTCGDWQRRAQALGPGLYLYDSKQCPFQRGDRNRARAGWLKTDYGLEATLVEVSHCRAAQANPCVWGSSGIVCNGQVLNHVQGGDAGLLKQLRRLKLLGR